MRKTFRVRALLIELLTGPVAGCLVVLSLILVGILFIYGLLLVAGKVD